MEEDEATQVLRDFVQETEGVDLPPDASAIAARLSGSGTARALAEAAWAEVSPERRCALWRAHLLTAVGLPSRAQGTQVIPQMQWALIYEQDSDHARLGIDEIGALEPVYSNYFTGAWVQGVWGDILIGGCWVSTGTPDSRGRTAPVGQAIPFEGEEQGNVADALELVVVMGDRFTTWGARLFDVMGWPEMEADGFIDPEGGVADEAWDDRVTDMLDFLQELWRYATQNKSLDLKGLVVASCTSYAAQEVRAIAAHVAEQGLPRPGVVRFIHDWDAESDLMYGRNVDLSELDRDASAHARSFNAAYARSQAEYHGSGTCGDWSWIIISPHRGEPPEE